MDQELQQASSQRLRETYPIMQPWNQISMIMKDMLYLYYYMLHRYGTPEKLILRKSKKFRKKRVNEYATAAPTTKRDFSNRKFCRYPCTWNCMMYCTVFQCYREAAHLMIYLQKPVMGVQLDNKLSSDCIDPA